MVDCWSMKADFVAFKLNRSSFGTGPDLKLLGAPDDLHPVQHEMAVRVGSQCGYCTPGFVCSMAAEFYRAGRSATNGSGQSAA